VSEEKKLKETIGVNEKSGVGWAKCQAG